MEILQSTWFVIIALLLTGYTVLDGFDLGVGFWHLFTRKSEHRQALVTSIGPVWDGNEVWLITAGATLFAAFPEVYATVFSGFYPALMLVLLALVLRAVSIEFGAKESEPRARRRWDIPFGVSSILAIILFGVAFGNILRGLELDLQRNYVGGFYALLNPYALLFGVLNLAMLATHGSLWAQIKTDGELARNTKQWAQRAWLAYLPLAIVVVLVTAFTQPHLVKKYLDFPWLWLLPIAGIVAIVLTGLWNAAGKSRLAFTASAAAIILLMISAALALFPRIVPALNDPNRSLTIFNASSSYLTLAAMFVITIVGMPLVLVYTSWAYRALSGKVKQEEGSH